MKHIAPFWNINDIKNLNIPQHSDPHSGFNIDEELDRRFYDNYTSAGVYKGLPEFLNESILEKEFSWISNKGYAIHKMLPNKMLPLHKDKYSYYSSQLGVKDLNLIVRVIVFLEDFKLGHILQIEGTPVNQWRAGDYVMWQGQKSHVAANLGLEDRYTLQITGLIDKYQILDH